MWIGMPIVASATTLLVGGFRQLLLFKRSPPVVWTVYSSRNNKNNDKQPTARSRIPLRFVASVEGGVNPTQNSNSTNPVAVDSDGSNGGGATEHPLPATSLLLKISYDGARFSGWSDSSKSNTADDDDDTETNELKTNTTNNKTNRPPVRSASRRRLLRLHGLESSLSGQPRFVEGVVRWHLGKLYGSIDPHSIVVEGCSRLDKGVHATSMVALIYGLDSESSEDKTNDDEKGRSIPGKRLPHPRNSTDATCFRPIPMVGPKLGYTLNRMLPADIRIMELAEPPTCPGPVPFHPTLSAVSKTYEYHLAWGPRPDPTHSRRFQWHVGSHPLDIDRMNAAATAILGTGQPRDFVAFRGAARGKSDQHKFAYQDTMCHMQAIQIIPQATIPHSPSSSSSVVVPPAVGGLGVNQQVLVISIRANRFLYKMVRFLVGAMVAVGEGTMQVQDVDLMMETGLRTKQFICAPAEGLILTNVEYDPPVEWYPPSGVVVKDEIS